MQFMVIINLKKTIKATTLVETLLYIAIASTLLVTLSAFVGTNWSVYQRGKTVAEVEDQGRQISNTIARHLRQATDVAVPVAGGSGSGLSIVVDGDNYVYGLSGDKLVLQQGAAAPVELNSDLVNVDSISFKNLSASSDTQTVKVEFTLSYNKDSSRYEYDYSETYYVSGTIKRLSGNPAV